MTIDLLTEAEIEEEEQQIYGEKKVRSEAGINKVYARLPSSYASETGSIPDVWSMTATLLDSLYFRFHVSQRAGWSSCPFAGNS